MPSKAVPKILFYWRTWGPYHLARLRAMKELGLDVVAWGLDEVEKKYIWDKNLGTEVRYFFKNENPGNSLKLLPKTFFRFWRALKDENVDVAFASSYSPWHALAFTLAAKARGIPLVLCYESHPASVRSQKKWIRTLKSFLIKMYSVAFVSGKHSKQYLTYLGFPQKNIETGYSCVDNDFYAAPLSTEEQLRAQALAIPTRSFLHVGRLIPKKNVSALISAFAKMVARGEQSHLCIVGYGQLFETLKEHAIAQGLPCIDRSKSFDPTLPTSPSVLFYGHRTSGDLRLFYQSSMVFVLPSSIEPWGLVVNEAMASGIPCAISSVCGTADDLILDSRKYPENLSNGFVFDHRNLDEMANCLMTLSRDPELRARLAFNAKRAVAKVSTQAFATKVKSLSERCH